MKFSQFKFLPFTTLLLLRVMFNEFWQIHAFLQTQNSVVPLMRTKDYNITYFFIITIIHLFFIYLFL